MGRVGLSRPRLFCMIRVFSIPLENLQLLRYKTRFIGRYISQKILICSFTTTFHRDLVLYIKINNNIHFTTSFHSDEIGRLKTFYLGSDPIGP